MPNRRNNPYRNLVLPRNQKEFNVIVKIIYNDNIDKDTILQSTHNVASDSIFFIEIIPISFHVSEINLTMIEKNDDPDQINCLPLDECKYDATKRKIKYLRGNQRQPNEPLNLEVHSAIEW